MAASPTHVDPPVLTAAGREHLRQRLERAQEALSRLSAQMSSGDRSAEDAAEHQRLLDQVEELTAVLAQSADVASIAEDPTIVEVGDEVDVEFEGGDLDTYALVHPAEARASDGRISIASPLGRALLGARAGDQVRVVAPGGDYFCTVRARRRLS